MQDAEKIPQMRCQNNTAFQPALSEVQIPNKCCFLSYLKSLCQIRAPDYTGNNWMATETSGKICYRATFLYILFTVAT